MFRLTWTHYPVIYDSTLYHLQLPVLRSHSILDQSHMWFSTTTPYFSLLRQQLRYSGLMVCLLSSPFPRSSLTLEIKRSLTGASVHLHSCMILLLHRRPQEGFISDDSLAHKVRNPAGDMTPPPQGRNDVTTLSLLTVHLDPSFVNSYFSGGCVRWTYKIVDSRDVASHSIWTASTQTQKNF